MKKPGFSQQKPGFVLSVVIGGPFGIEQESENSQQRGIERMPVL
ncbi:MAG: hypothetical protein AABP62_29250 [Planctomycetota bacterium]